MRVLLFDMEANGFLDTVDTIWCCVAKELVTGRMVKFFDPIDGLEPNMTDEYPLRYLRPVFEKATTIIGHNIIKYDMELLERFYALGDLMESVNVIDTLVWSQTLHPDRQLPVGCPTSFENPLTGKLDKITPHSVAAWGYRVEQEKPKHFDWSQFSPEMLNRCVGDVLTQEKILHALVKEAGVTTEDVFA